MQRRFSKEEQDQARGVSLPLFLSDYAPYRFTLNNRGYLLDSENPEWVGDVRRNWWYDNNPHAIRKNGNLIDWLMYLSGGAYSFPETMAILLEYANGGNWRQYLRNNKNEPNDFVPVEIVYDADGCPFN